MTIEPIDWSMPQAEESPLKNGREDRIRESKVGRNLAAIAGTYLILLFLTPLTMPADSIPDLSGRANRFDYATIDGTWSWGNNDNSDYEHAGHDQEANGGPFAWTDLNPIAATVYAIGDLNCHQKHYRSWEINGNQLAVCVRDIGILFGFVACCLIWQQRGLNRWTLRDTFLSMLPDDSIEKFYYKDQRMMLMIVIMGIGLVPMGIDGFTQLLTSYESTNTMRIITGVPAGFVGGWLFSAMFSARPHEFDSSEDVSLPADAKLRMV